MSAYRENAREKEQKDDTVQYCKDCCHFSRGYCKAVEPRVEKQSKSITWVWGPPEIKHIEAYERRTKPWCEDYEDKN